ncbi:MAG: hypothetical protein OEN23_02370 [Paracoccaceae bacterium]|nr:hypothetical protein [Paracoccaceae bacterium]
MTGADPKATINFGPVIASWAKAKVAASFHWERSGHRTHGARVRISIYTRAIAEKIVGVQPVVDHYGRDEIAARTSWRATLKVGRSSLSPILPDSNVKATTSIRGE